MAAALPGMPGLSGDLAGLAPELRQEVARWLDLWKQHRTWFRHAQGHLLTPVRPLADNTGWAAFEFSAADEALILAFRLTDLNPAFRTRLCSPDPDARYTLNWLDDRPDETRTGRELLDDGVCFHVPNPFHVAGLVIRRAGTEGR